MFGQNKALLNPGIPYLAFYRAAQVVISQKIAANLDEENCDFEAMSHFGESELMFISKFFVVFFNN